MKKTILLLTVFIGITQLTKAQQKEKHLKNITQLTFGGDNAEAYFSFNNKMLSFQSNNKAWGLQCDQIFNLDIKKQVRI